MIIYIHMYIIYTCTVFVKKCDKQLKNSPPSSSFTISVSVSQNCHSGGYPFQFPRRWIGVQFSDQHGLCVGPRVKSIVSDGGKMVIFFFRTFSAIFFLGCSFRIDVVLCFIPILYDDSLNDCNSWDGFKNMLKSPIGDPFYDWDQWSSAWNQFGYHPVGANRLCPSKLARSFGARIQGHPRFLLFWFPWSNPSHPLVFWCCLGLPSLGGQKNPRFPQVTRCEAHLAVTSAERRESPEGPEKPRSKDDRSEHKIYPGSNMTKSLNPSKSSICDRIVFFVLYTVDHCWSLLITVDHCWSLFVHLIQMCFF